MAFGERVQRNRQSGRLHSPAKVAALGGIAEPHWSILAHPSGKFCSVRGKETGRWRSDGPQERRLGSAARGRGIEGAFGVRVILAPDPNRQAREAIGNLMLSWTGR